MKRQLIILAVCASVIGGLTGLLLAESTDRIVAIVNGDVITEDELGIFMRVAKLEDEDATKGDPKEIRKAFLNRLVEDRLVLQEAIRLGVKPDDTRIEDRIKDMKMRAGDERTFERALSVQGLTLNELRQKLRDQFLVYMAIEKQVKQKIQVSPKEITEYYDAHRDTYVTPESASVDSIFVESQEEVARVQAQLAAGKDFMDVAREFSKKASLETITRGQFKKELEDFIFALTPGKSSAPFPVDGGFYIFLLHEIKPVSQGTISDVRDAIKDELEAQKTQKALREWVEGLKDKAYISIRDV